MSTNGARSHPNEADQTCSTELSNLAEELNALTDLMEAEWNERRTISCEHAQRLGELRRSFEQLIAE